MGTTLSTADRTARHDKLQLEREKLDLEKRKFALEEEERRLALEERRATFTERVKYLTPPPTRTPTPVPVVRVGRKVSSLELTEELPGQPATHLAPRPLTPTPTAVRPPQNEFPLTQNVPVWTGTHDAKPLVFISYCWHNCSCDPREVASWITEADHNVWLDVEQLGHGKPLFEELVAALKKATVVIAFISDAYSQSENCQKEFFFAKELKLPLIPVIVGPPKLHDHPEEWKRSVIGFDLMNALYIDARKGSPMEIKGQILHTLNLKLPSPTMPSTVTTPGGTLSMIGAAEKGDLSLCAELLQRGNHVNQSDANGLTPLWVASKAGHVSVVKFLLSHGGDAKAMSNDEVSVLHAAATQAKSEIIDLLLKAGADPLAKNKGGQTPVWVAARHGFHDTVQILLTAAPESAMADAEGKTPLHVGAEGGHLRVLTRLIEHDPNVEVMDHTGATPLYLASLNGRLDTAWKLLFHNADFTTSNNAGRNPLHAAAGAGHLELCQLILSTTPLTESIIDWTDKQTFTPLYLASQQGHLDVVKYLLDRGALVDGTAGAWAGPLHIAVYEGHVSIARLLIEKGARVGYPNKMGYTPLMLAAQRGQTDLVRMLSEAGGDVNKVLDNGIGALYLAARFGFTETVELLIELDANIHAPTVAGKTALSRARELGHTEVVKVLEKHGAVRDTAVAQDFERLLNTRETKKLSSTPDRMRSIEVKKGAAKLEAKSATMETDNGLMSMLRETLADGGDEPRGRALPAPPSRSGRSGNGGVPRSVDSPGFGAISNTAIPGRSTLSRPGGSKVVARGVPDDDDSDEELFGSKPKKAQVSLAEFLRSSEPPPPSKPVPLVDPTKVKKGLFGRKSSSAAPPESPSSSIVPTGLKKYTMIKVDYKLPELPDFSLGRWDANGGSQNLSSSAPNPHSVVAPTRSTSHVDTRPSLDMNRPTINTRLPVPNSTHQGASPVQQPQHNIARKVPLPPTPPRDRNDAAVSSPKSQRGMVMTTPSLPTPTSTPPPRPEVVDRGTDAPRQPPKPQSADSGNDAPAIPSFKPTVTVSPRTPETIIALHENAPIEAVIKHLGSLDADFAALAEDFAKPLPAMPIDTEVTYDNAKWEVVLVPAGTAAVKGNLVETTVQTGNEDGEAVKEEGVQVGGEEVQEEGVPAEAADEAKVVEEEEEVEEVVVIEDSEEKEEGETQTSRAAVGEPASDDVAADVLTEVIDDAAGGYEAREQEDGEFVDAEEQTSSDVAPAADVAEVAPAAEEPTVAADIAPTAEEETATVPVAVVAAPCDVCEQRKEQETRAFCEQIVKEIISKAVGEEIVDLVKEDKATQVEDSDVATVTTESTKDTVEPASEQTDREATIDDDATPASSTTTLA
ncbi:hypothetical protein HK104_009668, partial [Borealophlyctis nickersoniae]